MTLVLLRPTPIEPDGLLDPDGLLRDGPYGAKPPIYDGALVLASGGGPTDFPDKGAESAYAHEFGFLRAMRVLARRTKLLNTSFEADTVGSLQWDAASQSDAHRKVLINGKLTSMRGYREGWRLTAKEVKGGFPRGHWSKLFKAPWDEAKDADLGGDIIVPAYEDPFNFGMYFGWAPHRAAWALATAVAHVTGATVEMVEPAALISGYEKRASDGASIPVYKLR